MTVLLLSRPRFYDKWTKMLCKIMNAAVRDGNEKKLNENSLLSQLLLMNNGNWNIENSY